MKLSKNIADDVRILDFQTIRYVSPAQDLFHCIFTSTDKSFRDLEYDNLIELYYESLAKTVKLLGSDVEKLITMANLKDELKRYGNYLLIMTTFSILLALVDAIDTTNRDIRFENNGQNESPKERIAKFYDYNPSEFDRRINDLFDDIVKYGYYRKVIPN